MTQVQGSSDCCINSKYSSAHKGYFEDEFLSFFVKKLLPRSPIINWGYYIRFKAFDIIFKSWWKSQDSASKYQIISLGAGYDSSYFRMKSKNELPPNCQYIEIDFPEVLKRKWECMKEMLCTNEKIPENFENNIVYFSENYAMLGVDLTDLKNFEKCLQLVNVCFESQTLFLSECCITYINPMKSNQLVQWVQNKFPHSAFVAYEQIYPDDAFGLVMQSHFSNIGCTLKSISAYPDENTQFKRFKGMGWSSCCVTNMLDLYLQLPVDERTRVQQLEPFDEYEMFYEKCLHYVIAIASQGILTHCVPQISSKFYGELHNEFDSGNEEVTLKWQLFLENECVQRFGHNTVFFSPSLWLFLGGFGVSKKKHQRLGDATLYDCKTKEVIFTEEIGPSFGKRMFHSVTLVCNSVLVILGGRASPKKVFTDVLVFAIDTGAIHTKKSNRSVFTNVSPGISMPLPTWRHSAVCVNIKGFECIIVCGGCSVEEGATSSCFVLNTELWNWCQITSLPGVGRFSHSAALWNKSTVVVSGGITANGQVLNSVNILDCDTLIWSSLEVQGLLPRFSHTSHIVGNKLLLVGGVSNASSFTPGLALIDLKTCKAVELKLPAQDPEFPMLLCCHQSHFCESNILVVGGGGNCFSFGTHFNKKSALINVQSLID